VSGSPVAPGESSSASNPAPERTTAPVVGEAGVIPLEPATESTGAVGALAAAISMLLAPGVIVILAPAVRPLKGASVQAYSTSIRGSL